MSLHGKIKRQLGTLLMDERRRKQKDLASVCRTVKLQPTVLDNIELGRKFANWRIYEMLLDYYGVKLKITVVDK